MNKLKIISIINNSHLSIYNIKKNCTETSTMNSNNTLSYT